MILRTVVRDCLYVNWALPGDALGPAPEPLSWERHRVDGRDWVFASALLFRHERLRLEALPALRLSYPQFNLRLYTLDAEGVPSVYFHSILVPAWVVPAARVIGRQPAHAAAFRYPDPIEGDGRAEAEGEACWRWRVARSAAFEVAARPGAQGFGEGPRLGGWAETVAHLRRRQRGYTLTASGLRRVETEQRSVPVWPVQLEIADDALLPECLDLAGETPWPRVHSAWLCPEVPFVFELAAAPEASMRRQVPAPG